MVFILVGNNEEELNKQLRGDPTWSRRAGGNSYRMKSQVCVSNCGKKKLSFFGRSSMAMAWAFEKRFTHCSKMLHVAAVKEVKNSCPDSKSTICNKTHPNKNVTERVSLRLSPPLRFEGELPAVSRQQLFEITLMQSCMKRFSSEVHNQSLLHVFIFEMIFD